MLRRWTGFIKRHRRLLTADFIALTPHDDPAAKTYVEHPSSWDAAMRVAPPGVYNNSTGLAMLFVWNQVETPLEATVDLGQALRWADVSLGHKLSIASAIAGPSTTPGAEPSWAAGRGAVQVVVGAGGTAAVQLRLPAMAFEYYLIKAG